MMMEDADPVEVGDGGRMITALAWVSRGFAKPLLEPADPVAEAKNILAHSKMQMKLAA